MKKVIAMILTVLIALMPAAALAQSEPSSWAKNEVDTFAADFLAAANGAIDYAAPITRAQFAIVMLNVYGSVSGVEIPQMTIENPFVDCNDPLVVTAYGLGLVRGVSDNEFAPDEPITREAIATMIYRLAASFVGDMDFELPELSEFKDADKVSDWAEDGVKLCVAAGIIKGTDKGLLDPTANCTVEQALIIAKRIRNM